MKIYTLNDSTLISPNPELPTWSRAAAAKPAGPAPMTTTLASGTFRFRTAGGRTSGGGLGLRLPPMKALTCGNHVTVRPARVWASCLHPETL